MSEEAAVAVAAVEKSPAKKEKATVKAAKPKKAKAVKKPATHPKYSEMIEEAILTLRDRNGSARVAIEKYIAAHFNVGGKVNNTHLKQALKRGVTGGTIKQVKGVGASGSFKIAKAEKSADAKPKVKKAVKKPAAKKSPTKKPAKKVSKPSVEKKAAKPKTAAKKPVAKKSPKPAAKKAVKKTVVKKVSPKKPAAAKKPKVAAKSAKASAKH